MEPLLRPELWKSPFSSDRHPSHYLPCSRQFPLLFSPDELAQAQECDQQECFLPPISPHPTSPGSPEFPSFRSAICLNPLRHCAQNVSIPELSWVSIIVRGLSILLEHLDPEGPQPLSSPHSSPLSCLASPFLRLCTFKALLGPRQFCMAAACVSDSSVSASEPESGALAEPSRGLGSVLCWVPWG